jgi:hypothetical protein
MSLLDSVGGTTMSARSRLDLQGRKSSALNFAENAQSTVSWMQYYLGILANTSIAHQSERLGASMDGTKKRLDK